MIKSRVKVDETAVKAFNEEQKDWAAWCHICNDMIIGTLAELRNHKECHGK